MMFIARMRLNPLEEYTEKIKKAVKGDNAAEDIKEAVGQLLDSYGIQTPKK